MSFAEPRREICITGAHLVSSVADGAEEHWSALQEPCLVSVREFGGTGYLVHPLPAIDFSSQIISPLELKRMSRTHALGAYAAGRALDSARLRETARGVPPALVLV